MKNLTIAYIILLIIGAAIGSYFILMKPRHITTLTGDASRETVAVYQSRLDSLTVRLDTLKAALARRGAISGLAVRRRISSIDQQISDLRRALRIWNSAHDQYGIGQAYRECLLLYGGAQAACQSLSYDTLAPGADTARQQSP